jgi:membrane-bound lytic murein transglycosylase A
VFCINFSAGARLKFELLPLVFLAACTVVPTPVVLVQPVVPPAAPFAVSKWEMLPDWLTTDLHPSWAAFLQSCRALKHRPDWREVCARADALAQPDNEALRSFV